MYLHLTFNTAKHDSTRATTFDVPFPCGFTPSTQVGHCWIVTRCVYKSSIRKVWTNVRQNLFQIHQCMAQNYNKGRIPQPFKVGDMFSRNYPLAMLRAKLRRRCVRVGVALSGWNFLTPVTARSVNPTSGEIVTRAHLSQLKLAVGNRVACVSVISGLSPPAFVHLNPCSRFIFMLTHVISGEGK
jgi:hypothetical protein